MLHASSFLSSEILVFKFLPLNSILFKCTYLQWDLPYPAPSIIRQSAWLISMVSFDCIGSPFPLEVGGGGEEVWVGRDPWLQDRVGHLSDKVSNLSREAWSQYGHPSLV